MKYFLLMVVISTSCLPRDKNLRQKEQTKEEEEKQTIDSNPGTGSGDSNSSKAKNTPEEIVSYKYRFSSGELAIKINRKGDGNFGELQVIDLSKNIAIDSIPLSLLPQAVAGRAITKPLFLFAGDSYIRKEEYLLSYTDDPTKISTTELINNPPEIEITKFQRVSGQKVVLQGDISQKLTVSEWQQLAGQRPKAPSFADPSPLPSNLQQWFNNHFNSGFKKLEKLEHNRAVTIDGNLHYGAIYQGYDGANRCWVQLWGFDDVEVINFLNNLDLGLKHDLTEEPPTISCKNSYELMFDCERDSVKEQGVLKIVNNNLIVRQTKGKISVHIDSNGDCHEGAPTP